MGKWVVLLISGLICTASAADLVLSWNDLILKSVRKANVAPPVAARQMALIHLAMYDAANGVEKRYAPFHVHDRPPENSSLEVSVSSAAYHTLRVLIPASAELVDAQYRAILSVIGNGEAKTNGMKWGKHCANEILKLSLGDGSGISATYTSNNVPGYWRKTLPNYDKPLLPNWGNVRPLALPLSDNFLAGPPPPLTSQEYSDQFNEVKRIGATNSTTRTPQQREIALFWADGPRTETPPGHWNRIAQQLAGRRDFEISESTRLFAALNVAMSDAAIVCWQGKYLYNWWRPITAIRQADKDGNPLTLRDLNWTPLINSPPFPEHVSGHSSFSAAAAEILSSYAGGDNFSFHTTSDGIPGVVRRFEKFSDAAAEAGLSRIYGGIHFRAANDGGQTSGKKIGKFIYQNFFHANSAEKAKVLSSAQSYR